MKQWLVRASILNSVREADSGISLACIKWFPDHPISSMNASALDDDDFWNDPYPEKKLGRNVVEDFFRSPLVVSPTAAVLTLLSAVRDGLRSQLETP